MTQRGIGFPLSRPNRERPESGLSSDAITIIRIGSPRPNAGEETEIECFRETKGCRPSILQLSLGDSCA
jgi:hypothetical protein